MDHLPADNWRSPMHDEDDDTDSAPADPIGFACPDPDLVDHHWPVRVGDSPACPWCSMPDGVHEAACRRGVR